MLPGTEDCSDVLAQSFTTLGHWNDQTHLLCSPLPKATWDVGWGYPCKVLAAEQVGYWVCLLFLFEAENFL